MTGVHTDVKNAQEFCAIVQEMIAGDNLKSSRHVKRDDATDILAEQMIYGENFRVNVYAGRVIDVVHREMGTSNFLCCVEGRACQVILSHVF